MNPIAFGVLVAVALTVARVPLGWRYVVAVVILNVAHVALSAFVPF